jgi:chromosome partitioning protein
MKAVIGNQTISPRNRQAVDPILEGHMQESALQDQLVVAVGNVKGGVGKTTLAVNFAICQALRGQDVLLVDGDEQGTARAFTQLRAESLGAPGYTAVALRGAEIRTQIRLLRVKYGQIVVDVGGRDTSSLRAALTVADILVVPLLPATFDVWSLEPLDGLIQEAREINDQLSVITVLNAADARAGTMRKQLPSSGRRQDSNISRTQLCGARPFAMLPRLVSPCWSPGLPRRRRRVNSVFSRITFSDMLALSPLYPMAIAKHPSRNAKTSDKRAEKFILAAPEIASKPKKTDGSSRSRSVFRGVCWRASIERQKREA